jgi:hypothetical protein
MLAETCAPSRDLRRNPFHTSARQHVSTSAPQHFPIRTSARQHAPTLRAALLGLLALLTVGPAAAAEFTGYGKAKFGATTAQVQKLYPAARAVTAADALNAPFLGGPYITRLVLEKQKVAGLPKPITVELRFWKDHLWGVVGYFGDNTDQQVLDMLTKQLGAPQATNAKQPSWFGDKTQTTASITLRWYGVTDDALSKEAQAWLAEEIEKAKQHRH